jgi:hypothetical protein
MSGGVISRPRRWVRLGPPRLAPELRAPNAPEVIRFHY